MVKSSNRWKNSDTCSIKSYEYPVDLREPLDYDKFLMLPNIVTNAGINVALQIGTSRSENWPCYLVGPLTIVYLTSPGFALCHKRTSQRKKLQPGLGAF